ncbi:MBL fold metallo-hydrolase [Candidatus Peregrinibacteria bacterium]|nr:MBL fold metallo-hydrolase [Candidatus Peregrinibacteria bacterium]
MFWRTGIITGFLFVVLTLTVRELFLVPSGDLRIHTLDVGQGDSILLVSPSGKNILIDGGPDTSALEHLGKYLSFFDRRIDLLILTHPDLDHITALPDILKRYRIETILLTGIQKNNAPRYESFLYQITQHTPSIIVADPAKDIDIGDGLILDIIWPPRSTARTKPSKANNTSVVIRAVFGSGSILLTGDIETKAEMEILMSGADIRSDILKVPHHGSRTSSSTWFLLAIKPALAIVSAGRDNQFGHPHLEVMERYRHFGIPVRNTAEEGTISLSFP